MTYTNDHGYPAAKRLLSPRIELDPSTTGSQTLAAWLESLGGSLDAEGTWTLPVPSATKPTAELLHRLWTRRIGWRPLSNRPDHREETPVGIIEEITENITPDCNSCGEPVDVPGADYCRACFDNCVCTMCAEPDGIG